MIHLESFDSFKKREEFKGKRETYRFSNIHNNAKGIRVGDCKDCGKKEVDVAEHSNTCDKITD